jgi:hypothetical protein
MLDNHYRRGAVMSPEDNKVFRDDLASRLRKISDAQGLSGPDWQKTVQKLIDDPGPYDGRPGLLHYLKTGPLPQPQAGRPQLPSRGPPPATVLPSPGRPGAAAPANP